MKLPSADPERGLTAFLRTSLPLLVLKQSSANEHPQSQLSGKKPQQIKKLTTSCADATFECSFVFILLVL